MLAIWSKLSHRGKLAVAGTLTLVVLLSLTLLGYASGGLARAAELGKIGAIFAGFFWVNVLELLLVSRSSRWEGRGGGYEVFDADFDVVDFD